MGAAYCRWFKPRDRHRLCPAPPDHPASPKGGQRVLPSVDTPATGLSCRKRIGLLKRRSFLPRGKLTAGLSGASHKNMMTRTSAGSPRPARVAPDGPLPAGVRGQMPLVPSCHHPEALDVRRSSRRFFRRAHVNHPAGPRSGLARAPTSCMHAARSIDRGNPVPSCGGVQVFSPPQPPRSNSSAMALGAANE